MRAICQHHVRFHDRIETIDHVQVGLGKHVQFGDTVSIRETFHRDDLSRLEASMYWPTPLDVLLMKREIQTSFRNRDPTLHKYQPEYLTKIRETMQRSQRAVFREQDTYRMHLQEQDRNHQSNSKIKGPCSICTCNPDRMALAYRLVTVECTVVAWNEGLLLQRELYEQRKPRLDGAVPDLQSERGRMDIIQSGCVNRAATTTRIMNAHERKKFIASSA
jgi:hypothetical protein